METLFQDLRYGLRMLRKNPGFTAAAVLTLALGIGATTAIFSVVYGIVFRPLPYKNPDRLVSIWTRPLNEPGADGRTSMPDFKDWQAQNTVFNSLALYGYNRYDLPEEQGGDSVRAAMVSSEFFSMLGVQPMVGRALGPADDRERVAVLSYELWRQVYHGDRNVIGKAARLRDRDVTVVGVMPPSFRLPTPDISLWLSMADMYAFSGKASVGNWITNRGLRGYGVIGRLKDGVTLAQARTQMDAIQARLGQSFPQEDKGLATTIIPLHTHVVGNVRNALILFLGAVGFVLLIACVNVANLLLAKATVREREVAVRRALGCGSGRLVRQVLTESALLGTIGGLLGVLLAFWAVNLFLHVIPPSVPRLQDVRVDTSVTLFALGVSFIASLLFGLAPALRINGLRVNDSLRESARGAGEQSRSRRVRGALVACEIALALILVAGAGLMLQSFVRLALQEPGFSPNQLLTIDVVASLDRYSQSWQQTKFFNDVLAAIRAVPGVKSAGACTSMPPEITQEADNFSITGRTPADAEKSPSAWYLPATPGFLGTLGLPLLAGRDFNDADAANTPLVAIINQQIARQYFAYENPLGERINFRGVDRTIIGVAGDTTYSGIGAPADFQIYVPYAQGTFPGLHIAIRAASGDPLSLVPSVRAAVHGIDSEARATRIATMEQLFSRSILQPKFYAWLLVAFGIVALTLAAIGIFGVISYSVSQRVHEIGIRMALGAERRHVLMLVMGHGFRLTLAGVAIGVAGAMALTRFLSSLLFGITSSDPITFVIASVLLIGVALLACYFPARRGMKVDPMVALRYE
jgi:predicted permease